MSQEATRVRTDPNHKNELDGTGMYPLLEPIDWKKYLVQRLLPAMVIHLLVFFALQAFLRRTSLSSTERMLGSLIPALVLSSLFLLLSHREAWKRLGGKYFTRYESGRRFVVGAVISWAASVAFVYYLYFRLGFFSDAMTSILLAVSLLCGNLILVWLNYELSSYIMFGVLTWIVSVISFSVTEQFVLASPIGANDWSWIISMTVSFVLAVLFAFVTNRVFVFENKGNFWKDMVSFFSGRILSTLVFEYGTSFLLVNLLQQNRELAKFVGSFLVTIANYFISKYLIFKESKDR